MPATTAKRMAFAEKAFCPFPCWSAVCSKYRSAACDCSCSIIQYGNSFEKTQGAMWGVLTVGMKLPISIDARGYVYTVCGTGLKLDPFFAAKVSDPFQNTPHNQHCV